MSKPWTEKLSAGENQFMNEIIEQVSETHGVRQVFVNALQKLADAPVDPKFRYLIATDGDVMGTNDPELARNLAADDTNYVMDVVEAQWWCSDDEDDDSAIGEAK